MKKRNLLSVCTLFIVFLSACESGTTSKEAADNLTDELLEELNSENEDSVSADTIRIDSALE